MLKITHLEAADRNRSEALANCFTNLRAGWFQQYLPLIASTWVRFNHPTRTSRMKIKPSPFPLSLIGHNYWGGNRNTIFPKQPVTVALVQRRIKKPTYPSTSTHMKHDPRAFSHPSQEEGVIPRREMLLMGDDDGPQNVCLFMSPDSENALTIHLLNKHTLGELSRMSTTERQQLTTRCASWGIIPGWERFLI